MHSPIESASGERSFGLPGVNPHRHTCRTGVARRRARSHWVEAVRGVRGGPLLRAEQAVGGGHLMAAPHGLLRPQKRAPPIGACERTFPTGERTWRVSARQVHLPLTAAGAARSPPLGAGTNRVAGGAPPGIPRLLKPSNPSCAAKNFENSTFLKGIKNCTFWDTGCYFLAAYLPGMLRMTQKFQK